jgi:hypothetical protein
MTISDSLKLSNLQRKITCAVIADGPCQQPHVAAGVALKGKTTLIGDSFKFG